MMTVFYKPMRRRRWMRIEAGQAPPTWATFPMHDKGVQGSAKPGRGGRRKRRRRAAGERAWEEYRRAPFLSSEALLLRACRLMPEDGWSPGDLGRRERRRRAKLRRRRARRAARAQRQKFAPPGLIRSLAGLWWLREQQRRDMLRLLCR
jgi:hypothetical protein